MSQFTIKIRTKQVLSFFLGESFCTTVTMHIKAKKFVKGVFLKEK